MNAKNPLASNHIEISMARLHFADGLKELIRGVHELFPHGAELLMEEIVRHLKHREVNALTFTLSERMP